MPAAARPLPLGARFCDTLIFPADSSRASQIDAEIGTRVTGIGLGDFKRGTERPIPAEGALSKFLDATPGLRRRVVTMLVVLLLVNLVLIGTTLVVSTRYPALVSPAILAYTFGLRHAVDADHLAAMEPLGKYYRGQLAVYRAVQARFLPTDEEGNEPPGGVHEDWNKRPEQSAKL